MPWIMLAALASLLTVADDALVGRFLTRDDQPLRSYVALRRLEARNQRFKVEGWIEACVEQANTAFTYRIHREGGSGYIRNKVLRKALDGERDLIANGDPARSGLSAANYEFSWEPTGDRIGEAALILKPRRKDALLIDGRAYVTDPEADLLRVEGRLTKTPSFWTRTVDITRRYEWRGGVRVPVETTSTADVRLAGRSTFRMSADYVSVNGLPVSGAESARIACLVTQN